MLPLSHRAVFSGEMGGVVLLPPIFPLDYAYQVKYTDSSCQYLSPKSAHMALLCRKFRILLIEQGITSEALQCNCGSRIYMIVKLDFSLTNSSIDEFTEKAGEFLASLNTEKKNLLRIRLIVEDILLTWQEHFSSDTMCQVTMGTRFGRPMIQIEVEGECCDPMSHNFDDYGSYREKLLSSMGLAPVFSYVSNRNKIVFKLKKQQPNPLLRLAIAVVSGVLVSAGGLLIPDPLRLSILEYFLNPIYDAFFNLLGTIAGPMVFLSVAWGIYGIGDMTTFGRIGKRMVISFLRTLLLINILCVLLLIPFFSLNVVWQGGDASQLNSLFRMILEIIPTDIVTPFQSKHTIQIIFLAAATGSALLILETRTEVLAQTVEQINYLVQFLVEVISNMIPYFVFIILIQMGWSGTLSIALTTWKPILVYILISILGVAVMILIAARQNKVNPFRILKKGLPTLLISMSTASSAASFGTCCSTCERDFGISNNVTSFGVPLGIATYSPGTSMYFLVICIYVADLYQVECSLFWFVLLVTMITILTPAAPPIPGGTLTCYTIMFTQLGLPSEALPLAMALDVLFDFIATGMNMFHLQLSLIIQSGKMGILNRDILRAKQ